MNMRQLESAGKTRLDKNIRHRWTESGQTITKRREHTKTGSEIRQETKIIQETDDISDRFGTGLVLSWRTE